MRAFVPVLALVNVFAFSYQAPAQTFIRQMQLVDQVRARPSFLGIAIVDVDADRLARLKMTEERGVEITSVEEGSPAEKAGIKTGDVLLTYNGENILGEQQFIRLVHETPVGRHVAVSLWRNGKEQRVTVTPVEAQAFSMRIPAEQMRDLSRNMSAWKGPDVSLAFQDPNSLAFVMPDVPTMIMAWNSQALGVECEPVDEQLAQYFGVRQGVLVRSVTKGSVAEKAGFKAGDILLSVGDHAIKTADDFHRSIHPGNTRTPVAVMRDHKQLTLNLLPASDQQE